MNYKKAYYLLFNTITDCIDQLEKAKNTMIESQNTTENLYIESENQSSLVFNPKDTKE